MSSRFHVLGPMMALALAAVSVTPSLAAGSSCTPSTPSVAVENNWAWGSSGSWGLPGQQLAYQLQVTNSDVSCGSSSFIVNLSAPSGFSVSIPTNIVSLSSSSSGYLWAYVSSPMAIANGDYPLSATVVRAGTATPDASYTSYYKVYSSDTTAPTLFLSNPSNGETISGSSYSITVSSSDDHAVKHIDLYIDNVALATSTCDDVTYICHLNYKWRLHGIHGQHTVTFKSYDWMGNVGILTETVNVS
jgi:Bacterial Ig domain